jgi:hypothetical protein
MENNPTNTARHLMTNKPFILKRINEQHLYIYAISKRTDLSHDRRAFLINSAIDILEYFINLNVSLT